MVLNAIVSLAEVSEPLTLTELPDPVPGEGEVLLAVTACGACHTGLDEIEGRTAPPHLPVVPGHEVVGKSPGLDLVVPDSSSVTGLALAGSIHQLVRPTKTSATSLWQPVVI